MASPRLPWEVIERIIGHSGDEPETLLRFSLTCRDLRPRALCLLVSDVYFKRRVKVFDFCDFLEANAHLKPFVRSVTMSPDNFAPFPLLSILPDLADLTFIGYDLHATITVLNRSSLVCCKRFGVHIQTLHLSDLSFPTYLEFARLLLAFTNIRYLFCSDVIIKSEGNRAPLDVMKPRMSERLHLLTIDINFLQYHRVRREQFYDKPSVAALLLDSGLVQSTVETLAVRVYRSYTPSHTFGWPGLQSLVLKLQFTDDDIISATLFLKEFAPQTLKDVMVELESSSIMSIKVMLSSEDSSGQFEGLEQNLLRFSRPRITCLVGVLRHDRHLFWTQELAKCFPVLFQRGVFTVTPRTVTPLAGHDNALSGLAASPDGKWVATGSADSTIILWGTIDGAMAQQWIAHSYKPVWSIAFSPDGRYLASSGPDSRVKIWDLSEGSHELVAALEEHPDPFIDCAWSPRGDVIACTPRNRIIRLWDARTFRQLHVLEHADDSSIMTMTFSPDGHWLVSGCSPCCDYHVWNVASGTLHKSFRGRSDPAPVLPISAAFDPASGTRLAIVPEHGTVKVLDVRTGEELAVLRSVDGTNDVAFSPDGTLIVTASANATVRIWDAHTGVMLLSLQGHEGGVSRARFSPCGKYVASTSQDHTVRLWRTRDGSPVGTFLEHKDSGVYHVAFSPDGETLWSGDDNGAVVMRRIRDIIPPDERDLVGNRLS